MFAYGIDVFRGGTNLTAAGVAAGTVNSGNSPEENRRVLAALHNGELRVLVDDAEWQARSLEPAPQDGNLGCGRELFAFMRNAMSSAEEGACSFTESLNGWR